MNLITQVHPIGNEQTTLTHDTTFFLQGYLFQFIILPQNMHSKTFSSRNHSPKLRWSSFRYDTIATLVSSLYQEPYYCFVTSLLNCFPYQWWCWWNIVPLQGCIPRLLELCKRWWWIEAMLQPSLQTSLFISLSK